MLQQKKIISIIVTAILAVILAFVSIHSLWITIPLLLCLFTELGDNDMGVICMIAFAIALDVFAFFNSISFGIVYLVLGFGFFLLLGLVDKLKNHCTQYGCVGYILLYNIGTMIFGEWSLLLYGVPSLIVVFCILLRIHFGFVENLVAHTLDIEKQIAILESRVKDDKYWDDRKTIKRKLEELKSKKANLDAKREAQIFRQKYVNEDMERIEKLLGIGKYGFGNIMSGKFTVNYEVFNNRPISFKISALQSFNEEIQNKINEYVVKADEIIGETYKSVLQRRSTENLFWNYDEIRRVYSSAVNNPALVAACDKQIKKVSDFVQQKQDIINKNNEDIAKYNQLIQKLQKQYDDELALQKIKEFNKDLNSQMEDISDIENKEIKNLEFQNIISDIDILDKEINERRQLEIQFGEIEI